MWKIPANALKFALIAIALVYVLITLVESISGALIFGFHGLIMGPVFAFLLGVNIALPVALIGAIAGAYVGVGQIVFAAHQRRRRAWNVSAAVLTVLTVAMLLTYNERSVNVNTTVTHAAAWQLDSIPQEICVSRGARLTLIEYPISEYICSPALETYLAGLAQGTVVPVTYRVKSDYGRPHGYQLVRVGQVEIEWYQWVTGRSICGGNYKDTCGNVDFPTDSPLLQSSWSQK